MPLFEDQTPEVILERVLGRMEGTLQTREGSYAYDQAAPISVELWRVLMTLDELIDAFYVDEHSGRYLDAHAKLWGMERREGTRAKATLSLTGRPGLTVPAGTAFFTGTGLEFDLAEEVALPDGTGTGTLLAAGVGEEYNVAAGAVTQLLRTIPGLESYCNDAATGGTEPESDEDLFARIDARRKRPGTSGNRDDYWNWALSVDGVGGVKVQPLWAGPGTVRLLIVGYDSRPVDQSVVDACSQCVEAHRPIGANVTVVSAQPVEVNVSATILLRPSARLSEVRDAFAERLDGYLQALAFHEYTVYAHRIGALLMEVEGVLDYTGLTVNGSADNLYIDPDKVPVPGEVELM